MWFKSHLKIKLVFYVNMQIKYKKPIDHYIETDLKGDHKDSIVVETFL